MTKKNSASESNARIWFSTGKLVDLRCLPHNGTFSCIVVMGSVLRTDPQNLENKFAPWTTHVEEAPVK